MRRLEGERGAQIGFEPGERLTRQRVHQVEVEGVERRFRFLDRRARLLCVVHAAERLQSGVVEALDADRQPCHAGSAIAAKAIALERARVRFECDFAAGLDRQQRSHVGEQAVDCIRCKQARRAAADEDAVQTPAPDEGHAA
jgi:hypothetical protein